MSRFWLLALVALAALGQPPRPEQLDSDLEHLPFEEWLKGGPQAHIQWSLRASAPILLENQRITSTITVEVNGDEIRNRPIPGQLALILQIKDRDGHTYRSHPTRFGARRSALGRTFVLREYTFFIPGDYDVAAAIYDTGSREHSTKQTKLHIASIPRDTLAGIWRDMPHVGFAGFDRSRLRLPLETNRPIHIELIANAMQPRDQRTGQRMPVFLTPRLQVLSELAPANGSVHLTILDVEHLKVPLDGNPKDNSIRDRIPSAMRTSRDSRYIIDARGLGDYQQDVRFFINKIRERLDRAIPNDADRTVIVLSAALQFPKDVAMSPIEASPPAGTRVFYIRCKPLYGLGGADSLERTLEPLHPRVFDVNNATDFRRALGAIVHEISSENER